MHELDWYFHGVCRGQKKIPVGMVDVASRSGTVDREECISGRTVSGWSLVWRPASEEDSPSVTAAKDTKFTQVVLRTSVFRCFHWLSF
jgi:hypothetical protein